MVGSSPQDGGSLEQNDPRPEPAGDPKPRRTALNRFLYRFTRIRSKGLMFRETHESILAL
jgi:hypothetical protein